ncbi:putative membrane protein [Wickerhamomyces ciferrii]|uniref:Membrane protein n=1 Tax=Wickerhamomyces ciferrii (strain ATCC 14091 / BCRC 22168 / CBS 111 / JCM 3599 / NBRC 0793 / NRRL Y-1031 F-60-10) TaxID=1206466 RepID=K0KRJ8_WICCF|nr:uncharacterized protein BN7_5337 [Wickerhamomyces ciferrii]CCH45751.1 putative membrane protein [Wickerhamomyces ciferrii]
MKMKAKLKEQVDKVHMSTRLAFENMDTRSRVTQGIRIGTALASVVLIITLLAGAHNNPDNIYTVRLDTSKIDVSKGLFTALRNDLSHNEMLDGNFGAGLTSSEVIALSDYAEAQLAKAPDFITSSLYGWCSTTHDYKIQGDYLTSTDYTFKIANSSRTCSKPVNSYFFDYRSLLSQSHFEIILEYAYGFTGNNQKYIDYLRSQEKAAFAVPRLLIFVAVSQVALICLLFAYYNFKNDGTDISKLFAHISSGISLASFVACTVACVTMTVIYLRFRTDIHRELSPYGLKLHLGTAFFTILWFIFALCFLSMASWGGPTWCAPPPIELDDEVESQMAFLVNENSETDSGGLTSKPTRTSTKMSRKSNKSIKSKKSTFRQFTKEIGNNEHPTDRSVSPPNNFLTNEEEVVLKSNDTIFRSGTFRY